MDIKKVSDYIAYLLKLKELYAVLIIILAWGTVGKILSATIVSVLGLFGLHTAFFISKYEKRKKFIANNILGEISRNNLIEHSDIPYLSEKIWFWRRRVYWPVVPNPDISLIHAAFINCLLFLMEHGFDVHILVFDRHYQGRRKGEHKIDYPQSAKEVNSFITALKDHGLKSDFTRIVKYKLESKLMNSRSFHKYSVVCEQITSKELMEIGRKKLSDEQLSVLRLLKPISIIAFLAALEETFFKQSIAMTLCGKDEESIFSKCHYIIKNLNNDSYIPYQIFLPQFNGFVSSIPGVLDATYSLSMQNKEKLKLLARSYHDSLPHDDEPIDSMLFLIKNILFDFGDTEAHKCIKNPNMTFRRNEFIQQCNNCSDLSDCVIEGVFHKFYDRKMSVKSN